MKEAFENINLNIKMIKDKKKKSSPLDLIVNDLRNCLEWALQYAEGKKVFEICTPDNCPECQEVEKQNSFLYEFDRVDITNTHILIRNNPDAGAYFQTAYEYWVDVDKIKETLGLKNEDIEEIDEDFIYLKKAPAEFSLYETINFKPLYTEDLIDQRTNFRLSINHERFYFFYDPYIITFKLSQKAFEDPSNVKWLRSINKNLKIN